MRLIRQVKNIVRAFSNQSYRYMYWQRRIEGRAQRAKHARALAELLPKSLHACDVGANALKNNGYFMFPNLLSPMQVEAMHSYFSLQPVHDVYRPELGSFACTADLPSGTHVAGFDPSVAFCAPFALDIANRPEILGAVSSYLGCRPLISVMHAWWSVPAGEGQQHAEFFHRDFDDFKFVKLFIYLTDVAANSGPHVFISRSQNSEKLTKRIRFTDDDVETAFPDKSAHIRFLGPAGTAFIEDTSGLHKGEPPTDKPRLIFQVLYSLKPNHGGISAPVRPPTDFERDNFDAHTNSAYLSF